MDEKYPGGWSGTGSGSEYSKIKKWGDSASKIRKNIESRTTSMYFRIHRVFFQKQFSVQKGVTVSSRLKIGVDSELYLAGYRIDPDNETNTIDDVDFYTLYLDGERPIDCDGRPIIFFDIADMNKALDISNCGCNHLSLPAKDHLMFIDIPYSLYETIEKLDEADSGYMLDCLNAVWDFTSFLPENQTGKKCRKIIRNAANYFTTSYDIASYFSTSEDSRMDLIQAVEWVIGVTLLHAKYVRPA